MVFRSSASSLIASTLFKFFLSLFFNSFGRIEYERFPKLAFSVSSLFPPPKVLCILPGCRGVFISHFGLSFSVPPPAEFPATPEFWCGVCSQSYNLLASSKSFWPWLVMTFLFQFFFLFVDLRCWGTAFRSSVTDPNFPPVRFYKIYRAPAPGIIPGFPFEIALLPPPPDHSRPLFQVKVPLLSFLLFCSLPFLRGSCD